MIALPVDNLGLDIDSRCPPPTMEMDALDAAITSLDVTGPFTTEHLAQLLRGLAKTITGKFDLLLAKKYSEFKGPETWGSYKHCKQ